MDGGGQNTIEARLQFTVDSSGVERGTQQARAHIQQLDRSAQEAQKSLDRLSHADRAAGGGGSGTYGVGPPPLPGTSSAQAYANSMRGGAPLPTWQVGAAPYAAPSAGPGGYRPPVVPGRKEAEGPLAEYLKAAAMIEVIHKVIESLAKFGESLDRAAVTNDAAGRRLGEEHQGSAAYNRWVADAVPGSKSMAGAVEFIATSKTGNYLSPLGARALRRIGHYEEGDTERAAVEAYDTGLMLARQPALHETERQQEELRRRGRSIDLEAGATTTAARAVGRRMPGYLREYELHPEVAAARVGAVLPAERYKAADEAYALARGDSEKAREEERLSRMRLQAARGAGQADDAATAPLSGVSAHDDAASRNRVIAATNDLYEKQQRLLEAIKREEQAGVSAAKAKVEASRARVAVTQAELGVTEGRIGQQKSGLIGFAGTDTWDRQSIVEVSRKWKTQGPGSLSPDEVQTILPFLSDENREKLINYQLNSDTQFSAVQQNLGQQQLPELRRERDVKVEAVFKAQLDEAQVAAAAQKMADELIPQIERVMNEALQTRFAKIELELQKQQQAGNN